MNDNVIIELIKRKYGKVKMLNNGWCHFVFHHLHFIYVPEDKTALIRIILPHITSVDCDNRKMVETVVMEINREVRFVKAMILNNGSVSLNYDHRISNGESIDDTIVHIINTLYAASEYLKLKIKEKNI